MFELNRRWEHGRRKLVSDDVDVDLTRSLTHSMIGVAPRFSGAAHLRSSTLHPRTDHDLNHPQTIYSRSYSCR